jgi:hypothetical protein
MSSAKASSMGVLSAAKNLGLHPYVGGTCAEGGDRIPQHGGCKRGERVDLLPRLSHATSCKFLDQAGVLSPLEGVPNSLLVMELPDDVIGACVCRKDQGNPRFCSW